MRQSVVNYEFKQPSLLEHALTHRSAGGVNNERLEYLGDAVLNFVIAQALFDALPEAREGHLSRLRASLVKGTTLAEIAVELDLGQHLHLGSGELKSGGFRRESILADAVEAVLGAVLLDGGFESAKQLILSLWSDRLTELPSAESLKDPKTRLQEYLQSKGYTLPEYTVDQIAGQPHSQTFSVLCKVRELKLMTTGSAGSRRQAEQLAAEEALRVIDSD